MSSDPRDAIVKLLNGNVLWKPPEADREFLTQRVADRILAIPEIAEALKLKAYCATLETGAVDGDTGIKTGPGSGNTPEDQWRDVSGLPSQPPSKAETVKPNLGHSISTGTKR